MKIGVDAQKARFVLDVTMLVNWNRPPVGIVRTLYEVAKWFYLTKITDEVIFVKFSEDKSHLIILDKKELSKLFEKFQKVSNPSPSVEKIVKKHHLLKNSQSIINYDRINRGISFLKRSGIKSFFRMIFALYFPNLHWRNDAKQLKTSSLNDFDPKSMLDNDYSAEIYKNSILKKNDVYISLGIDWYQSNYDLLSFLKNKIGFKFIGICYDLIPISYPQYIQSQAFSCCFFKYIFYLNHISDKIACISEFTRTALLDFRKAHSIENSVDIETIYIGDNLGGEQHLSDCQGESNFPRDYVLYVSTVESRKNHVVLVKAYVLAYENRIDLPELIIVGMFGWGISEFHDLFKKHPFLRDKIKIYDRVNDQTLNQLYLRSLFCVFP
ncbi:MAG: hypothetical protein K2X69_10275, partial [Silvanigrellaceae bacterium]|nr:hypothetical protein [Silvanigrellaceae bacterium]